MTVSVNTETTETPPVGPVVLANEPFAETPEPFEQMLRSAGNILNTHYTSYEQTNRAGNRLANLFHLIDTTPHEYEIRIDEIAQDQNGQFQTKWTGKTDSKLRSTRLSPWVKPKFDTIIFSGIEFGNQQIDVTLSQNSEGTAIKTSNPVDPIDRGKVVGALKTHIDRAEKYFENLPQKPQLFNFPKSR